MAISCGRGEELGIPTPVNEALTAMIKAMTVQEKTGPGVVRIDGAVVQPVSLDRRGSAPASRRTSCRRMSSTLMPGMTGTGDSDEGIA